MPAPFALKLYQRQTLDALKRYLALITDTVDARTAFIIATNRPYHEAPNLPGLPYICLRVPTGGGKTVLAAHSVGIAADALLRTETPCVLWLVPSQTIRDQTLATLQNREHPNRRALAERFGENVRIMTVMDALYAKRPDYDGGAVVIVATIQSFRVDETEGRKVYAANGELMDHFSGLDERQRARLEPGPGDAPVPSLANVLRLRRPMVIVDEAHNARTQLSFDVLARLAPSVIVEFTATPVTPDKADIAKGITPSNVLHHVSAAELKASEMIKLPVVLRGRADPNDTIADAIAWLDELDDFAKAEELETGEFIRPIMLLQSERKSATDPNVLHADVVKRMLIEDVKQPEEAIVIATGTNDELGDTDLFARDCPVRFIITQAKLREGWDCSFAYVLCSVAEQKSATAVEQILGRVLRLPNATRKRREELNRAYAFATTNSFQEAAKTLKDGLVNNGFEKIEAQTLVLADEEQFRELRDGGSAFVFDEPAPAGVDLDALKAVVEGATGGRVTVDMDTGKITARGALSNIDRTTLGLAVESAGGGEAGRLWTDTFVHKTRGARLALRAEAETASGFTVPRLTVMRNGRPELFDRVHFLDIPWALDTCDPAPITMHYAPPSRAVQEAHVDVSTGGHVTLDYIRNLHDQLALELEERNWTKPALINWLDRRLPNRRDITPVASRLFISKVLDFLMAKQGATVETLARAKFRLVDALAKVIADHRDVREKTAFEQAVMFPQSGLEFQTNADHALAFTPESYAYQTIYSGAVQFRKHFDRRVGDLEAKGEEHECAVYLDNHAKVTMWVRNTAKQRHSFWLQTSSDRFYPDFLALLTDGRVLALEYKGAHLASTDDSQQKQLIGDLWAERSSGTCLFAMISDKRWADIDRVIGN
jgi:type III restriction enzyme